MSDERRDWRELCAAASKENDSDKLMALVDELMEALDEQKLSPGHPGS